MDYRTFLRNKQKSANRSGFRPESLGGSLFPFQKQIVNEALEMGKFGIFADCGLGKTLMELEWAQQVSEYTRRPVLITCPLAVAGQTLKEASKFGYSDIARAGADTAIQVINYDQLHNIDPSCYAGIVLDESSILKNFEGSTKKMIIDMFAGTPFKLCGTATPAPNDPMELGNHSEFLNRMSRSEMLSMYFVHDGGETAKWRLKGHAIEKYYQWVRSWATMLRRPSDIGYSDNGFILPGLNYIEHQIKIDQRAGKLFNDVAVSSTNFHGELRATLEKRMSKTAEVANSIDGNLVIWIKHDEEARILRSMIPEAIEVKGSDDTEYKEEKLLGFADNQFRILITKTSIASFGLNYQNCHNTIFASPDFSFEKVYQAIRRFLRFGQQHQVNAHIITTDTMTNVIQNFKVKERQHNEMQYLMTKAMAA